ncbi:MAG: hypothetical protein IJP16_09600 [Clostridia bacterium]|nr:hypothetical protein [Clostridia bacterium]
MDFFIRFCYFHLYTNTFRGFYLDSRSKQIEVRIHYVPNFNDGEIPRIAELLLPFKNAKKVRVLPYHNLAGSKYIALGMENTLPEALPRDEEIKKAQAYFE